MAHLITLEGIDGCGKSTLLRGVKEIFKNNKLVKFVHTPIAPFRDIRHTLKNDNYDNFLFYQASNSYLSKQITSSTNKLYVLDRFSYSTYIVHSLNEKQKKHINDSFKFLKLIVPEMMFLVKADCEICRMRISQRKILSEAEKLELNDFKKLYEATYCPNKIEIKDYLSKDVKILDNNVDSELQNNMDIISSYISSILEEKNA